MRALISRRVAMTRIGAAGAAAVAAVRFPAAAGGPAGAADIVVSSVSPYTLRLTFTDGVRTEARGDGALVDRTWPPPAARLAVAQPGTRVSLAGAAVTFGRDPSSVRVEAGGRVIQEFELEAANGALSFVIGGAPVLGLGAGGPQFDRRGSLLGTRSGQGGYRLRTHGGRVPVQWMIGTAGWAMFVHQPYGAFDLTGDRGRFLPDGADPMPLDLFLITTADPERIMAEYALLTGRPEMPPLWSFGYQQSHRTITTDDVMNVARTFREKKLPCDALIYLGTDFTPSGWNTHNGEFTWNPSVFPDPRGAVDALHALHYKVVLHTVMEGRHLTGTVHDGCARQEPSGRTPAGQWPDDRTVGCYWPHHKGVFDLGIDGWWPDQGDGLDPPSRLNRIRMYWEGSQLWRPDERPYALHRNGHPGMQRYGAFLWSGDVYSTWETLKTHVPVAINAGLSGVPYWGTDIGGFVPTKEYTGELHVRWFQFGAFCPLFRAHGRTWHLRLPWGWNTGEPGPNEVSGYTEAANPAASELHNAQVEPICRKYLELRYRLLPYLYSVVREGYTTGLPVVRALWLHYPKDPKSVPRSDQYLWGRDILVSPVTEKGATTKAVYLPPGVWYDFWSEEKLDGGREVSRAVDLETMPLHVRAGAILPFGPLKEYTAQRADGPLSMRVYPGANGCFLLYEDDGESFAYRRGEWMGIVMNWDDRRRRLTLRLADGSRLLPPRRRSVEVRLVPGGATHVIVFDGRPVEIRL
jgi:alpha-glucosidase (family GH31 glycosyl hydrolase)